MSMSWFESKERNAKAGGSLPEIRSTIAFSDVTWSSTIKDVDDHLIVPRKLESSEVRVGATRPIFLGQDKRENMPITVHHVALEQCKPAPPLSASVGFASPRSEEIQKYLSEQEVRNIKNSASLLLHGSTSEMCKKMSEISEEKDDLHELLWFSDTAAVVREVIPKVFGGQESMRAEALQLRERVVKLEEDLMLHGRIIRDQQKIIAQGESEDASPAGEMPKASSDCDHDTAGDLIVQKFRAHDTNLLSSPPTPEPPGHVRPPTHPVIHEEEEEEEQVVVRDISMGMHQSVAGDVHKLLEMSVQKDSIISQMDRAMANYEEQSEKLQHSLKARDLVLSQRQAELSAKDDEIAALKELNLHRERQNAWLRSELQRHGHTIPRDLDETIPPRSSLPARGSLPDRNTVQRRIAMRNSPGQGSPSTLMDISVSNSPLSMPTALLQSDNGSSQPAPRTLPIVASTMPMSKELQRLRLEVQGQLTAMSRNRANVYSPRTSSVPFSAKSKSIIPGGRKALNAQDTANLDERAPEGSIVTL